MMSARPFHHPKYRTKLCRNFSNGNCPFGHKCSFLHPAPGINPLSSSLAQYLFNWNILLPQLFAFQQEALKKMPRWSSPRPQGPQLVDEGPSPPASLLLSTSESAFSDQIPQTRRSSRRKKSPCRQFTRTGGWCPAGEKCIFHHDAPSAESGKMQHVPPFETDIHRAGGRTISGSVLIGMRPPSPPIISQGYSEPSRYTKAQPAEPYQPLYWPGWHPCQSYYPSVPVTTTMPVPASMAPPSATQHNRYHPPPTAPPVETRTGLPPGAYEVNGTTYFPTQVPSATAPAPVTCSVPIHPDLYDPMALGYPYYAPPPLAGYYNVPNERMDDRPHTSFDPFSSDPMMTRELPVVPQLDKFQMSPIQCDDRPHLLPLPSVLTEDPTLTTIANKPRDTEDCEFPYQPPKEQRVGHARRISINIKKHGRANSG